jgi:tetratricopeptide (TPR) repeat protein
MSPPSHLLKLWPGASALLACMVTIMWASPARAQAETTAAEDYARGAQLYNEGRNREALEAFNSAIGKADDPIYVCNRAVVLITLEEYDRAIDDLTVCRDTYDMPDESRAQVDAQLKALDRFESMLRPRAREVARLIANPPAPTDSSDSPPPIIKAAAPAASPLRAAGWVSLGLGAGALVGMGAVEVVNRDEVAGYKADCAGAGELSGDVLAMCKSSQQTLRTQRRLARTLLISGGALGMTGVVLLLTTRRPAANESAPRTWRLTPELGRDGARVVWTLSF